MELDDQRRAAYDLAQDLAAGWERQRRTIEDAMAPVRAWMLGELAPAPGDTVLELAAATGDTGFEAAAIAGDRGVLISSDFSPAMVAVARRRGAELGLANVEHRVIDAERIGLGDESVDGVLCRSGYMMMVDPGAALRETRRVLRPGGRLALAVWGPPERNPWLTNLAHALSEHGHIPSVPPKDPHPFSLADGERVRTLLEQAGFTSTFIDEVAVGWRFQGVGDYLAFAADVGGGLAPVFRGLSQKECDGLVAWLDERLAPFATADGYRLPGIAIVAVAS